MSQKITKKSRPKSKTINIALQGGGAHGAFAWGVLDKLLEDGRLEIDGVCATSAGTMNACALAYGMHKGGADGARQALHDFWHEVSSVGEIFNPVKSSTGPFAPHSEGDFNLAYWWFDSVTRILSPYQLNPFDFNPLRDILAKQIDFGALQSCDKVKLFISATNVRSGKVEVFNTSKVTLDVAMASACLPYLYKAVEINGEAYWDGGYMGNPALFPLFYETDTRDILIVHINPIERPDVPETAPAIMNRMNEISFNGSLLKEIRAIAFVKKLIDRDMLKDEYKDQFTNILVHSVRADEALSDYSVASKFGSDWTLLTKLRDKGREAMAAWLEAHFADVGLRDSVDLHADFLDSVEKLFDPVKK